MPYGPEWLRDMPANAVRGRPFDSKAASSFFHFSDFLVKPLLALGGGDIEKVHSDPGFIDPIKT